MDGNEAIILTIDYRITVHNEDYGRLVVLTLTSLSLTVAIHPAGVAPFTVRVQICIESNARVVHRFLERPRPQTSLLLVGSVTLRYDGQCQEKKFTLN
jgi:hypothetical protein